MTAISRSDAWYLFDYGMVISTAPEPDDWQAMEHATGLDLKPDTSPYWATRADFDSGKLSPAEYWSGVLDRSVEPQEMELLESLDSTQWSHLNAGTLSLLATLQDEQANLALLSNMPARMADRYLTDSSWAGYFSKTYFSGQLGLAKPDKRIFDHVAADLGVNPRNIVFIDDNAANIAAAQGLGLKTVLHTAEVDLRGELSKIVRS